MHMYKHAHKRLHAVSLLVSLDITCLQYSQCLYNTFVYEVSFIKFKKTSQPPHNHTSYSNQMNRTMRDHNEHWLNENVLSFAWQRSAFKGITAWKSFSYLLLTGNRSSKGRLCRPCLCKKYSGTRTMGFQGPGCIVFGIPCSPMSF